jgi:hypothetical protein
MIGAPIYYERMTPEQEQRLGEMMFAEVRSAGRVNKATRDADNEKIARREKLDDGIKRHIFLFLKNDEEPKNRIQIIRHLNVGAGTIDRCLKRLADEGLIRRIQTRTTTHWETFK